MDKKHNFRTELSRAKSRLSKIEMLGHDVKKLSEYDRTLIAFEFLNDFNIVRDQDHEFTSSELLAYTGIIRHLLPEIVKDMCIKEGVS